jgi:hypothetical protein
MARATGLKRLRNDDSAGAIRSIMECSSGPAPDLGPFWVQLPGAEQAPSSEQAPVRQLARLERRQTGKRNAGFLAEALLTFTLRALVRI